MPLALLIVGVLLLTTVIKGNYNEVASLLSEELTGSKGFLVWVGALLIIGVVGKAANAPLTARAFTALIIVVFLLANSGVFTKFEQAVSSASAAPADETKVGSAATASSAAVASGGSSGGDAVGTAVGVASSLLK